ncbi:MAG TPA: N-acetylmuramoyl-L-alanine amidase [Terriglobales bacterium]|nr:N-acetylmuramoyl-L-alanine amidase [Terriglobales bacterium]
MPELSRPYSTESDPIQRLLAFAYVQAQKTHQEAEEELRKDAGTLSAVLAAQSQLAAAHLDLEQSLEFIADGARRLTGAGGAAIALREGRKVVCRGRSGLIAPDLGACLNPDSGISGECLSSGEVQLCDDTERDRRVDVWVCRNLGMRSILAVPLRRQEDVLGIIVVFSGWAGVFGERDIRALKLLAGLVIEALWSHEIHQRQAPAPQPVARLEAPEPAAEALAADLGQILEAAAAPALFEPALSAPEIDEILASLEAPAATPAAAQAALPAPEFAVFGSAEPRRLGRTLAILAVAIAVLAGATGAVLWRGAALRELLHLRPAAVAPRIATPAPKVTPTPETPSPAPSAEPPAIAAPELPSGPAPAAGPSQLLSIRSWSKPEGTTIALFLAAPARWEAGALKDPERIYFDLENTQLAPEMLGKSREGLAIQVNDALVKRVRVGMLESSAARIVIDLAAPAEYSAVLSPTEPYRLMIVIRGVPAPSSAPAKPEPAPSKKTVEPHTPASGAALNRHPKIVIDPGHGGAEDGAIGHSGLKEKDLTLEIAKRLGGLLSNRLGAEVIYTRTSDLTVALDARAAIANQAGADLFISIHANSSDDTAARGVETYYVANSPSSAAVSLAGRENAAKTGALKPVAEERKLSESHKLAVDVQQALYHAFGGEKGVLNRGVKQAPFVVLLDADMPSILAEVAFVTSPTDEHKLSTAEGQEAVADALCRGIARYLVAAKRNKVVATLGASTGQ